MKTVKSRQIHEYQYRCTKWEAYQLKITIKSFNELNWQNAVRAFLVHVAEDKTFVDLLVGLEIKGQWDDFVFEHVDWGEGPEGWKKL